MTASPKSIAALFAALVFAGPCIAADAPPAALGSLSFLLGEWEAQGSGAPREATGGFSFRPELQGRVIGRTNHADYPAAGGKPASRHDDLMVLYATDDGEVRADYYDSEGHVIRYSASVPGAGQLTLVSDPASSAPRFRLSYRLRTDGTLDGSFEIAPPGKPDTFQPYLSWAARRKGAAPQSR
jgi:hypothetical protein